MNSEISHFASVAQIWICGVAALTLFAVYSRGYSGRVEAESTVILRDPGFFWFGLACICWCIAGAAEIYDNQTLRLSMSVPNSVCMIGAAVYLDFYIRIAKRFRIWKLLGRHRVVVLASLGFVLACVLPWFALDQKNGPHYPVVVDFIISTFVILVLMVGLCASFLTRRFWPIILPTVVVTLIQLLAQIPELAVVPNLHQYFQHGFLGMLEDNRWQLVLSSKAGECTLFLALGYSFIHEKAEDPHRWMTDQTLEMRPEYCPKDPVLLENSDHFDLEALPEKNFQSSSREGMAADWFE